MTQDHTAWLVVGLKNPGNQYSATRHNAGAWLLDELARKYGCQFKDEKKAGGSVGKFQLKDQTIYLLLPDAFMNDSGKSIASMLKFYKLQKDHLLIAHDELDLAPGHLKLKAGGGTGGHNGLKSTIQHLAGFNDFYRLRLGIGHPGHASAVTSHVLSKPSPDERQQIDQAINTALDGFELMIEDFQAAMKTIHTKKT